MSAVTMALGNSDVLSWYYLELSVCDDKNERIMFHWNPSHIFLKIILKRKIIRFGFSDREGQCGRALLPYILNDP